MLSQNLVVKHENMPKDAYRGNVVDTDTGWINPYGLQIWDLK